MSLCPFPLLCSLAFANCLALLSCFLIHHSTFQFSPHRISNSSWISSYYFSFRNISKKKGMAAAAFSLQLQYRVPARVNGQRRSSTREMALGFSATKGPNKTSKSKRCGLMVKCSESGIGIGDFIGGDLLRFDLGCWLSDVEEHKALAIYTPHEGGYEGRYLTRLRYQGYYFLDLTARGLGDPETTLTKIHPVCPAHVGKQPIARWYFPPEVDYRLQALPPDAKGLVVWIIEAKVLSKSELQFLALLPTLRPKVRVIAECGNWRKFMWKPLREIAGLSAEEGA